MVGDRMTACLAAVPPLRSDLYGCAG